jgi:hypothetical protein
MTVGEPPRPPRKRPRRGLPEERLPVSRLSGCRLRFSSSGDPPAWAATGRPRPREWVRGGICQSSGFPASWRLRITMPRPAPPCEKLAPECPFSRAKPKSMRPCQPPVGSFRSLRQVWPSRPIKRRRAIPGEGEKDPSLATADPRTRRAGRRRACYGRCDPVWG